MKESLNLGRLPSPKQERFDKWPENGMPKELGENVSRINAPTDVKEPDDIRGNSLTNTVISQGIMTLVEGGMWDCATGDNTLVVPKHVGLSIQRASHHPKSIPEIHDLFSGNSSSNKFGSIGGSFNSLLALGEPCNRSLVDKMKNASAGSPSGQIVHEVSILKGGSSNKTASWNGHVKR
jgi:hypothetical protein